MDISPDTSYGLGLLREALDAGALVDLEVLRSLELLADEEDSDLAQNSACEPAESPPEDLPLPGLRTRGLISLLADDFDDTIERKAFLVTAMRLRAAAMAKTKPIDRMRVLAWLFGTGCDLDELPHLQLPGAVTFHDCWHVLGLRPIVLQTRMMFQLYLDWLTLSKPFPFETVPIPEVLEGELFFAGGLKAIEAATVAWKWPGARTEELLSTGIAYDGLKSLDEKGLMGRREDNWYCIGRNPIKHADQRKIQWDTNLDDRDGMSPSARRAIWDGRKIDGKRLSWAALWPSA